MRRFRQSLILLGILAIFSGCASYELGQPGSGGTDAYKSVYVNPVRNESLSRCSKRR